MPSEFEESLELDALLNDDEEMRERESVPKGGGPEGGIAEEEEEKEGGIRIRSQDDGGIFEQDDEEEDDDYFDFPMPEVEMKCPPTRKRKQELSFIENELTDIVEIGDEEDQDYHQFAERLISLDSDMYSNTNSRKRERLPLYLLNPEDFPHDPKKQMQIRRAIITYRHHQEKKEQIIKLTEENKLLREHVTELTKKVIELSRCGCKKNETADLSVLDTVIPVVPPRMYVRGSKPVLAVPYNRYSQSPSTFSKSPETIKQEGETTIDTSISATTSSVSSAVGTSTVKVSQSVSSVPPSTVKPISTNSMIPPPATPATPATTKPTMEVPKPLINITASRLASFNSKTLSSANVVTPTLSRPPLHRVGMTNGTQPMSRMATRSAGVRQMPLLRAPMPPSNTVSISGMTATRPGFIPISLASVKTEPGASSTTVMSGNHTRLSTGATAPIPLSSVVKNEITTPATATPVSRIVFAKKGSISSNALKTASQLYFGTKSVPPQGSSITGRPPPQLLAAPQMTANSIQRPGISANFLNSANNTKVSNNPSNAGQVFRTPSGQVLKLVQPPGVRKLPATLDSGVKSRYQHILPKPVQGLHGVPEMISLGSNPEIDEVWNLDEEVDDEMALIAAITGSSTPQRNRKQAIQTRKNFTIDSRGNQLGFKRNIVVEPARQEIELSKYEDVVFEEAD